MFEVKNIEETNLADNPVIAQMSKYNHEQLLFCNDNATGLKAIIAVHNTVLGPSLGGTRMWAYNNEVEALTDVLRFNICLLLRIVNIKILEYLALIAQH